MSSFRPGDVVTFRRLDGAIVSDTVRSTFVQTELLEPYARNRSFQALTLTEHSWCAVADVIGHKPSDPRPALRTSLAAFARTQRLVLSARAARAHESDVPALVAQEARWGQIWRKAVGLLDAAAAPLITDADIPF